MEFVVRIPRAEFIVTETSYAGSVNRMYILQYVNNHNTEETVLFTNAYNLANWLIMRAEHSVKSINFIRRDW